MEMPPPFLYLVTQFMLLLFTSYCPQPAITATHSNFTDLSALLAFKAHVGDPYGTLATNWTTNTSFCSWVGVSCNRPRLRVVALKIKGFSLRGTIPPHLANLSFLSDLELSNNTFGGPIPAALGRLPRLKTLNLERNQLSGSIPPAIFNMSLLTTLLLDYNNLSGPLPVNHSLLRIMLPQLQVISVSYNQLSGEIPSSFTHVLRVLSLSFNQFGGIIPAELGNLPELRFLYLADNNLRGIIPTSLGNLTKLIGLDLIQNNLHGELPHELGSLVNLQRLAVERNSLAGPIPISLSNASMISFLDLSYNNLTGSVPTALGNMRHLEFLILEGNQLQGALDFVTSLSNCRDLGTLHLSFNELDGVVPDSVGNLSMHLLQFSAFQNYIKGDIPAGFGNLSSLVFLDLNHNKLTGTIPSALTRLDKLQELYLDHNMIQGSIPHNIGQLRSLIQVSLDANLLYGSIPDSVGNITGLQALSLSINSLSLGIPGSVWSLRGLLYLDLSKNSLDGLLSQKVGNLNALDLVDLSANRLSGSIPNSIQELQMLQYLSLYHNLFQGLIPQSIGGLISIEYLDLSSNALSGAIPKSLAGLHTVDSLNLSFNMLEGKIPDGGPFSNATVTSLTGNLALCGAPQLGFPSCHTNNVTVSNSRTRQHLLKYILPTVASTLVLVTCSCLLVIFCRQHRRWKTKTPVASDSTPHVNDYRLISYHEIVRATDNFSEANLVGRGNFGLVFKGCFDDGLLAAIKVLNLEVEGSAKSFSAECHAMRMVRHRNLVKIISTCSNPDFKALVLQFIPNGSLERWLYSHNYCLSLLQRINIMLDVALALEYLHHHNPQVVVHCDLKPSNVLLDEEMTAHVSDFGIAKLLFDDSNTSIVSATTCGTIGYMPPEYGSTGKVSRRGDVYSYGIMLLETFTRKKPTDAMFVEESNLRQWVSKAHPTRLLEIVDCNLLRGDANNISCGGEPSDERPRDDPNARHQCLSAIMELGLLCSRESRKERILIKDVVTRLQKIKIEYLSKLPN